jgi:GT2 family glycosyltransferase
MTSLLDRSTYKPIEIIIIENGSKERETHEYYKGLSEDGHIRIVQWSDPFNYSAMNNFGARQAEGEMLLFLNNDTEVINSDWMERMLEHSLRINVGATGAKLYYSDGKIQHAGVILGIADVVGHSHKYFTRGSFGYKGRLKVVQNLSAVTGACLMTRKEVFEEVGGFDERFAVSFNDIDLCLKMGQRGYYIVWTPYAELYHHEGKTRGRDDTQEKKKRFREEAGLFKEKWAHFFEKGDPYYNPNLTHEREDFSIHAAEIWDRRERITGWR